MRLFVCTLVSLLDPQGVFTGPADYGSTRASIMHVICERIAVKGDTNSRKNDGSFFVFAPFLAPSPSPSFFFQQMLVKSVQAVQVRDFVFIHCQNLSCELHQITRVFSHSYK